MSKIIKIV